MEIIVDHEGDWDESIDPNTAANRNLYKFSELVTLVGKVSLLITTAMCAIKWESIERNQQDRLFL